MNLTQPPDVPSQAITILVKNVKSNKISETQLQVLLGYAEEDIYDQSRQATAFGLLKVRSTESVLAAYAIGYVSGHLSLSPPGDLVQEAYSSRDGGGVEESSQALCHRRQRHDKNPLSTGIC